MRTVLALLLLGVVPVTASATKTKPLTMRAAARTVDNALDASVSPRQWGVLFSSFGEKRATFRAYPRQTKPGPLKYATRYRGAIDLITGKVTFRKVNGGVKRGVAHPS